MQARLGLRHEGKGRLRSIFNSKVHAAIKNKENLIYESTGKSDKFTSGERNDFHVVAGINSLDFCDLSNRNAKRATKSIMSFMKNPDDMSIAAPRLPDLRKLDDAVRAILHHVMTIIDCVGEPVSEDCPAKFDEVYVFNNEHWGFLPSLKLIPPTISDASAQEAFKALKKQAKTMVEFMTPRACGPSEVIV